MMRKRSFMLIRVVGSDLFFSLYCQRWTAAWARRGKIKVAKIPPSTKAVSATAVVVVLDGVLDLLHSEDHTVEEALEEEEEKGNERADSAVDAVDTGSRREATPKEDGLGNENPLSRQSPCLGGAAKAKEDLGISPTVLWIKDALLLVAVIITVLSAVLDL